MYKVDKKLDKVEKQIAELIKQKKELEEAKKEREKCKIENIPETTKKRLLRLGRVLDEAGIKTIKQAKELISINEKFIRNLDNEESIDEIKVEENKKNVPEGYIEKGEKVFLETNKRKRYKKTNKY